MAKKLKDPWHKKTFKLIGVDETLPLLLAKGKNGAKPRNEFKLVAGSVTGGRVDYYKVQFKDKDMVDCWKDCVFVPRGNRAPELRVSLGRNPSPKKILSAAKTLIRSVRRRPVTTQRLDCDVTVPVTRPARRGESTSERARTKQTFGSLRLYQVPKKLGRDALLVVSFAVDGDPDGSGGAGSVHN
jgi:hypothetical protein